MNRRRILLFATFLAALSASLPSLAAPVRVGFLGDSLSASATPNDWVVQLTGDSNFTTLNAAQGGATSASVISSGQDTTIATAAGSLDVAVLMIGGNDITGSAGTLISGGLSARNAVANTIANNIEFVLHELSQAGIPHLVVATVPDVTVTPAIQAAFPNPSDLAALLAATQATNVLITSYAAAHGIPVMDMYAASELARNPITIGGVTLAYPSQVFISDNFHPNTAVHGIMANMFIEALDASHFANIPHHSDQQILTTAGIAHPAGTTFFNVSPLIIPVPEPSSLALAALAGVALAVFSARRRTVVR